MEQAEPRRNRICNPQTKSRLWEARSLDVLAFLRAMCGECGEARQTTATLTQPSAGQPCTARTTPVPHGSPTTTCSRSLSNGNCVPRPGPLGWASCVRLISGLDFGRV